MNKGRRAVLVAPLIGAVLLLGAPAATFAAPKEGQPPPAEQDDKRGSRSAEPEKKGDKAAQPGNQSPGNQNPGNQNSGKDPKAGDKKEPGRNDEAGDKQAGDRNDPKPGEQAAPPKKGNKDNEGRDRDDDDYGRRYDGPDGRYDHGRYGYHGRYGWDTHRRYYRHGYNGPGWYDDCGYYGPDGTDGYYRSPDACSWQYGPQGDSLRSNMSGDQVGPQPGAPSAFGTANVFVDLGRGVLCYRMGYDGISRPTGAHVHRGGPGQSGQPVIDLQPVMNGDEGCVGADPTALRNLREDPEAFYLQLHTPEHPDGAIRGQLFRTGSYR